MAFKDGRELINLDSYERGHRSIRNYFIFELAPLLFPQIETYQNLYSEYSYEESDQQKMKKNLNIHNHWMTRLVFNLKKMKTSRFQ